MMIDLRYYKGVQAMLTDNTFDAWQIKLVKALQAIEERLQLLEQAVKPQEPNILEKYFDAKEAALAKYDQGEFRIKHPPEYSPLNIGPQPETLGLIPPHNDLVGRVAKAGQPFVTGLSSAGHWVEDAEGKCLRPATAEEVKRFEENWPR